MRARKRKIAIYANGWNRDALFSVLSGLQPWAKSEDFDIYVFCSHASYSPFTDFIHGELNIYDLCHIEDYDAAIVFTNMLNAENTAVELCRNAKKHGVPIVSIGIPIEDTGIPCVVVDNTTGMRELVTHLVEEHHVKRVVYVGGGADHIDNICRLKVTKEVLEAHGLTLAPEDIYSSNWDTVLASEIVRRVAQENMPDAFICANDVTALASASELSRLGFNLPDDVLITGFDNVSNSSVFYPAITTVTQRFDVVGDTIGRILSDLMKGKEVSPITYIESHMVDGESCGCPDNGGFNLSRRAYCQKIYTRNTDTNRLDNEVRSIFSRISNAPDYESLKKSVSEYFEEFQFFCGDTFYLMLNDKYLKDLKPDEEEILSNGFADLFDPTVSIIDGKAVTVKAKDPADLTPGYKKKRGEQHIFYFLPLHIEQFDYGYTVYRDNAKIMVEASGIFNYLEKIEQAIKMLRINLRIGYLNKELTLLYDTDQMTGLYNRFGFVKNGVPLFERCRNIGEPMTIMFVDINSMKKINDEYGHLQGDYAIRTVAQSIQAGIPGDWFAIRYGGDEFLIIGSDEKGESAEEIKKTVAENIKRNSKKAKLPYKLTASCGYVITDPKDSRSLEDYIKLADNMMYEIKRKLHAKEDKA